MEHDLHGLIDSHISLDISQIKCVMKQLLEGVLYLHSNGVMHRDIKGANILYNNKGEIKLTDFGLAKNYDPRSTLNLTNRVVTLWYRAPELLLGSEKYTPAIDMWSVGCCFAELLTLKPLFDGLDENRMLDQIFKKCGIPSEPNWPGVSLLKHYHLVDHTKKYTRKLREDLCGNKKYLYLFIIKSSQ
jgi:serine/threonine protein kinase